MACRIFKFFLILLFVIPLNLYAQDEVASSDTTTTSDSAVVLDTSSQPAQQLPLIVQEIMSFEKEFNWEGNQALNLVKTAISLPPPAYQESVLYEFRNYFLQKISNGAKSITYWDVVRAIESIAPNAQQLESAKKLLELPPYNNTLHSRKDYFENPKIPLISQQPPVQMTPEEINQLEQIRIQKFLEE